ncbi:MAG TPA: pyrrolo-quinoline quinone, partial [Methylomirabilota bacterium]|nr:pyrrolo-quinoline quinone [Methylomirabilota bacterium]
MAVLALFSMFGVIVHAKTAASRVPVAHPLSAASSFPGVFTFRNDGFRTGQNLTETILTPSTVKPGAFGRLFIDPVDAQVYTQPLYVPAVPMTDDVHNVVYVATELDSVYAFDADEVGPPLWHTSFIDPKNGITAVPSSDLGCGDLTPWIGITATPVIDPDSQTLYVLSKEKLTKPSVSYRQRLHALDIATGLEKLGGPVTITATVTGTGVGNVGGV